MGPRGYQGHPQQAGQGPPFAADALVPHGRRVSETFGQAGLGHVRLHRDGRPEWWFDPSARNA